MSADTSESKSPIAFRELLGYLNFSDGTPGTSFQAALDGLSPKLRDVLVLAVYQGLAYQEIAAVLSIPLGTVKSRVFNALIIVKEKFNET